MWGLFETRDDIIKLERTSAQTAGGSWIDQYRERATDGGGTLDTRHEEGSNLTPAGLLELVKCWWDSGAGFINAGLCRSPRGVVKIRLAEWRGAFCRWWRRS